MLYSVSWGSRRRGRHDWSCRGWVFGIRMGPEVRGVWLVVLASSPTLYGKVPRLILKKTSRLPQAVVFFRTHFLCGALLCNCSSAQRGGLPAHCTTGMFSRTLYAQNPVANNLHISPRFSPTIVYRDANSVLLLAHLCTAVLIGSMRRTLCSKLVMMRA